MAGSSAVGTSGPSSVPLERLRSSSSSFSSDDWNLLSSDPIEVRQWLSTAHHRKHCVLLDKFLVELRRGRLLGSSSSSSGAKATTSSSGSHSSPSSSISLLIAHRIVNLLRHMIGSSNWKSSAEVLCLLRGIGRELVSAAQQQQQPAEDDNNVVAVGNIVRRVMAAVREETEAAHLEEQQQLASPAKPSSTTSLPVTPIRGRLSLESMLWALPQHVRKGTSASVIGSVGASSTHGASTKKAHHLAHSSVDRAMYDRQDSAALSTCVGTYSSSGSVVLEDNNNNLSGSNCNNNNNINNIDYDLQSQQYDTQETIDVFPPHYYVARPELKQAVMESIEEIITDLEDLHKNINSQALDHIHTGDVILTVGLCKTVELFLKSASSSKNTSKRRTFHVIIVDPSPPSSSYSASTTTALDDGSGNRSCYEMAQALSNGTSIETTVICESAVFAVMSRVHKVFLPARAVLADGGLVTTRAGTNLVALAANYHSVPVHCVTGLFKLCPRFPHEGQDTLNDLLGPQSLRIGSDNFSTTHPTDNLHLSVEYINPAYDYIEPKHIGLYITNVGSFQPSFIYRILAENYHTDDWDSFE